METKSLRGKLVAVAQVLLAAAGLGLLFLVSGGPDLFEAPVQVIVPRAVEGLLCVKAVPGPARPTYWILANGFGEMSGGQLEGNARKQLFRAADETRAMEPVADAGWTLVRVESDRASGVRYAAFWLGREKSLRQFASGRAGRPFCLRR